MGRGRPIAVINKENAEYMRTYFNNLLHKPKEVELFFIDPLSLEKAKKDFEKINQLALAQESENSPTFDQEKELAYYRLICRFLDENITEEGFQRAIRAYHQSEHRKNPKGGAKKRHMDVTALAYDQLSLIAQHWKMPRQVALEQALNQVVNHLKLKGMENPEKTDY